jgi:hypothetical protein
LDAFAVPEYVGKMASFRNLLSDVFCIAGELPPKTRKRVVKSESQESIEKIRRSGAGL